MGNNNATFIHVRNDPETCSGSIRCSVRSPRQPLKYRFRPCPVPTRNLNRIFFQEMLLHDLYVGWSGVFSIGFVRDMYYHFLSVCIPIITHRCVACGACACVCCQILFFTDGCSSYICLGLAQKANGLTLGASPNTQTCV